MRGLFSSQEANDIFLQNSSILACALYLAEL